MHRKIQCVHQYLQYLSLALHVLDSSDLQVAWEALQEEAKTAGLPLQKLDKKAEKALLQEHKAALRERLSSQDEPAEALSLVVPLLVVQVCILSSMSSTCHPS